MRACKKAAVLAALIISLLTAPVKADMEDILHQNIDQATTTIQAGSGEYEALTQDLKEGAQHSFAKRYEEYQKSQLSARTVIYAALDDLGKSAHDLPNFDLLLRRHIEDTFLAIAISKPFD